MSNSITNLQSALIGAIITFSVTVYVHNRNNQQFSRDEKATLSGITINSNLQSGHLMNSVNYMLKGQREKDQRYIDTAKMFADSCCFYRNKVDSVCSAFVLKYPLNKSTFNY